MTVDYVTARCCPLDSGPVRSNSRRGLTLIEIMIALTMTLIVLGAMMTAFQYASAEMQSGRALMELANRARTAESLLRSDLAHLTLDPRPYAQTSNPPGYFEYIEGPRRDKDDADSLNIRSYLGDVDDALGMTVRSSGRPFRGRNGGGIIESSLAEVVWFTTLSDRNSDRIVDFEESVNVHRRVLLIRPDLGVLNSMPLPLSSNDPNDDTVERFFKNNDISARVIQINATPEFNIIANDLTDLAIRKYRFCHIPDSVDPTAANNFPNQISRILLNNRKDISGGDIILTDVAGFDLQVYSPDAGVNAPSFTGVDIVVDPGDPGFDAATANLTSLGAFVDLNHAGTGWFGDIAQTKSQCNYEFIHSDGIASGLFENVYDTWTPVYESDGINQDGDEVTDEGTDGLDNFEGLLGRHVTNPRRPQVNGVDDTSERETLPPYPYPIRGMKVSIRLVEKDSKQVHQTSIIHSFVPE